MYKYVEPAGSLHVDNSLPLLPILSHTNSVHILPSYLRSILILASHLKPDLILFVEVYQPEFYMNLFSHIWAKFLLQKPYAKYKYILT
jgi:hypothetical protein